MTGLSGPGLEGQVLVVVGAASGIGRASARLLAARGARVACLDRDAEGCWETVDDLLDAGAEATAAEADVTRPETLAGPLRQAAGRWGGLHGLVNCAGITGRTGIPSHRVALADFDTVVAVNLRGALAISQAVLPIMLEQGYGRLLHVASIAGKEGNAGMVSYSATKAGLIGMVKSMAKDYAETGVTVNALAPAVIQTPLVERMPPEQVDYMTSRIPMRRLGTLTEVAEMIAWIVSPAASFTTGFTFDLSGGRATY